MTTQPIRGCPQPQERISSTRPSIPLSQIARSQTPQDSSSRGTGRSVRELNATAGPAEISNSSVRGSFLGPRFSMIFARTCEILGVLLVLVFGITQLVAQDKSTAISKESELVTLALSCSDEKVKSTSICQQFLNKFPDGPAISRREDDAIGSSHYEDLRAIQSAHGDFEYLAVHLAIMDRFLQKQSIRFQSALNESNPSQSLAQLKEIDQASRAFLQNLKWEKSASTVPRRARFGYFPTAELSLAKVFKWVVAIVLSCSSLIVFLTFHMEFAIISMLYIYYRCREWASHKCNSMAYR